MIDRLRKGPYIQIGLGLGLLWYVLKDISLADLYGQLAQVDGFWLLLFAVGLMLYHVMRAWRWQLTLQALHYAPSLLRVTVASLAGMLASSVVPGAGELTRCTTLKRTDGVPISTSVGLVVAERLVDLLMLAVLCSVTALLEAERVGPYLIDLLHSLRLPGNLSANKWLWLLGLLLIGGVIGYWLWQKSAAWQRTLAGLRQGVLEGLSGVYRLKQPILFVALTLLSNVQQCLCTYILLQSLPATASLPPSASLAVLTLSSLGGLAVPTQGGMGTFHFLVSRALVLYGLPIAQGVVVATFMHAVSFGINLLFSLVSFLLVPFLPHRETAQR